MTQSSNNTKVKVINKKN